MNRSEIDFPGSPKELGDEIIRRTMCGAYPMGGYDLAEIREGVAQLGSKDHDEWAELWSTFGERHFVAGGAAERVDHRALAQKEYGAAYDWFSLARWPTPHTDRRRVAYARSLDAFQAFDRLTPRPAQALTYPIGDESVTVLLRTPEGPGPFPLYVQIAGLDGYKESFARNPLAADSIATLTVDAPGTGQSVKITPDSWRALQAVIDAVVSRPEIDSRRVVLMGGSFGGYWATVLAYRMPDTFRGVVALAGPLGIAELGRNTEYLFDLEVALIHAVRGAHNIDDVRRLTREMSLDRSNILQGRTPPMLLVNGAKDAIVPIENLYRILSAGETAKEAWVNPQGLHVGRQEGVWSSARIFSEVVAPWVYARLKPDLGR